MSGPLSGTKVIEIAGIGPGPFAAMMLADMGAEVIRVDRAGAVGGDPSKPNLEILNRGRRSIGVDLKSPELPPQNQPFTRTFITGSWDGQVIFDEPMVTRDFILAQRSGPATAETIALPQSKRYVPAGFYPDSYGIRWDEAAGEYRIALQGLTWRD